MGTSMNGATAQPTGRNRLTAGAIVAVAALAAGAVPMVLESLHALDEQRTASAGVSEQAARTKCLADASRPDLAAAVGRLEREVPPTARFQLVPPSSVVPCLAFALLPRRPVRQGTYDPSRDWALFDGSIPAAVRRQQRRERALPPARRQFVSLGPSLVLARPSAAVAR
jgi:hypothetical protein